MKSYHRTDDYKYIVTFSIIIFIVFFYDFTGLYISNYFSYIDELLVVGLFCGALIRVAYEGSLHLVRVEKIIALMVLALFFIGGLSSLIFQYQGSIAVTSDFIVFAKPFVAYFSGRILYRGFDIANYYQRVEKVLLIILVLIGFGVVFDLTYDYFPTPEYRFGLPTEQLFFGHPSRYAFAFSILFLLLYPRLLSKNKTILIIVLLLGVLSLRYKYFGFMALAIATIYIFNINKKLLIKRYVVAVGLLFGSVVLIGTDQLMFHYSKESAELGYGRAVLGYGALMVADDHFPLGSGYATFASYYSGVYYSPLYSAYGISSTYGLSEDYSGYIADSFWPMVVAQFGYAGFAIYLVILFQYFRLFISLYNTTTDSLRRKVLVSGLLLILLLLIDSTSDSILTQNRGMVSFFLLSLFVNSSLTYRMNKRVFIMR